MRRSQQANLKIILQINMLQKGKIFKKDRKWLNRNQPKKNQEISCYVLSEKEDPQLLLAWVHGYITPGGRDRSIYRNTTRTTHMSHMTYDVRALEILMDVADINAYTSTFYFTILWQTYISNFFYYILLTIRVLDLVQCSRYLQSYIIKCVVNIQVFLFMAACMI